MFLNTNSEEKKLGISSNFNPKEVDRDFHNKSWKFDFPLHKMNITFSCRFAIKSKVTM